LDKAALIVIVIAVVTVKA